MATARRNLRNVRTLGGLTERRRIRTPAAALLEMSVLANEKQRLNLELDTIARRQSDIAVRLAEIREKEIRLQTFIGQPPLTGLVPSFQPTRRVRTQNLEY